MADDQVRITRAIDFSTSLRHALPGLSEQENRARFGPLSRQHGHNYRLEVTLRGVPDPVTGMVMDLKELADVLDAEVMARFDHRDLNRDTDLFEKRVPSPENLAGVIWELLEDALPAGLLDRLRLHQDAATYVDVIREPEPAA